MFCFLSHEKGSGANSAPELFVGLILGQHQSAIGQFFPCP